MSSYVYVPPGHALRIAAAWNSCSIPDEYGNGSTTLADFDLVALRLHGWCTGSTELKAERTSNEWEMIYDDCMDSAGGTGAYAIGIRQKAGTSFVLCDDEPDEPVAIAWDIVPLP